MVTSSTSGNGTVTSTFTYNPAGELTTSTLDPDGLDRSTAYTYDSSGLPLSVTSTAAGTPRVDVTRYTYDPAGNIASTSVGDGTQMLTSRTLWTQRGNVAATLDARSSDVNDTRYRTDYTYDPAGWLTTTQEPPVTVESYGAAAATSRPTTRWGIDVAGRTTRIQDAAGTVSVLGYDAAGRLTSRTAPAYTPPGASTSFSYLPTGQLGTQTNPDGSKVSLTYDSLDRVVRAEERAAGVPAGSGISTRFTHDDAGNQLSTVGPTGATTWSTYDDLDRVRTLTIGERYPTAANFTSRFSCDDLGQLVRSVDARGGETGYSYDKSGALLTSTDPAGVTATLTYKGSLLDSSSVAGGTTTRFSYDAFGRLTRTAELASPSASIELRARSLEYDAIGQVTATVDGLGTRATSTFDAGGRLTSTTQPTSSTSSITETFGYDALGRMTRSSDGRGNATWYTYNTGGLPESTIEPSTAAYPSAADRTWTTGYDITGRPVKETAPGGVVTTLTYDPRGRITQAAGSGAEATTPTTTFGYDDLNRVVSAQVAGKAAQTFSYDDRNNILSSSGLAGSSSFGYDENGDLVSRSDAGGGATFTYDAARRISSATIAGQQVSFGYDPQGRLSTAAFGTGGPVRTFGYDDLGRLQSDTLKSAAGADLYSTTYAFDAERTTGRAVTPASVAAAGSYMYGYDKASRLTSWTGPGGVGDTYGYDASGNRATVNGASATFDARNRLLDTGSGTTFTYKARGTRATKSEPATHGNKSVTTTSAFDAFDRFVSDGTVTNAYDALNRLASVTTAGVTSTLSYSGVAPDAVADGGATYGRGAGGELVTTTSGGVRTLAVSNLRSDVVAAVNAGTQTVTASTAYTPYGTTQATVGKMPGSVGYQGDWTGSNGLVNMHARWYDPSSGGFLSRDSVMDGLNRYAYAGGSPIDANDPTGHLVGDPTHTGGGYAGPIPVELRLPSLRQPRVPSGARSGYNAGAVAGGITAAAALALRASRHSDSVEDSSRQHARSAHASAPRPGNAHPGSGTGHSTRPRINEGRQHPQPPRERPADPNPPRNRRHQDPRDTPTHPHPSPRDPQPPRSPRPPHAPPLVVPAPRPIPPIPVPPWLGQDFQPSVPNAIWDLGGGNDGPTESYTPEDATETGTDDGKPQPLANLTCTRPDIGVQYQGKVPLSQVAFHEDNKVQVTFGNGAVAYEALLNVADPQTLSNRMDQCGTDDALGLGNAVLNKVLDDTEGLGTIAAVPGASIAVNYTPTALANPLAAGEILELIRLKGGQHYRNIHVEITENQLEFGLTNPVVQANIALLRGHGVKIDLDDYTGVRSPLTGLDRDGNPDFSNGMTHGNTLMDYLAVMPDTVKIDAGADEASVWGIQKMHYGDVVYETRGDEGLRARAGLVFGPDVLIQDFMDNPETGMNLKKSASVAGLGVSSP